MIKRLLFTLFLILSPLIGHASLLDVKISPAQIFDVQWNIQGTTFNASNFTRPFYSVNPNGTSCNWCQMTTAQVQAVAANNQYFGFFPSTTNPGTYGLAVYNANGSVAWVLHNTGSIRALSSDVVFYNGNNFWGTVISVTEGFNYGASNSWTGITNNPTQQQVSNYEPGATAPLAAGETAPPPGPPPPAPTPIYNNSSNVYITNHFPTSNNSPAGEGAANAFDNDPSTKYLNFDKQNAGVTVKLNQGRVVTGFTLTTANDFSGRDPTSYKLYGSNDGVNWTLIKEDTLALSDSRFWTSSMISVSNSAAYVYYYIFFPTTKAGTGCGLDCDSMQIGEITYYYDANDSTSSTATGTTVSNPSEAPTPAYRNSAITSQQAARRASNLAETSGHNAQITITGDGNDVYILQAGTGGHYAGVDINGSSNDVDINQTSLIGARHYLEASIVGSSNVVNLTQSDSAKTQIVSVNGTNNDVTTNQKGTGNHFLDLSIVGDNHTASIVQDGSGNHEARVALDGSQPWNFSLNQDSSTSQRYTLPHDMSDGSVINGTCSTIGGCNLTVNQQ